MVLLLDEARSEFSSFQSLCYKLSQVGIWNEAATFNVQLSVALREV